MQSEKEKTHAAEIMTEECQDKLRQAEQERDYALSHQKKVEIPVEKPVLYQKCGNCNLTAYLKAKEKYDTQREKLAGRYKTKTAMYEALMFLLIWYSVSTTLFQMIRSKIFISDCVVFFDTIATFIQTIAGWIILTGKNMAQISNGISNPVVAGIVYWLIRILICGGCLVGAGILVAFIEIKIAELYKKCCWDMITIMVILISMATAIYFGKWIKTTLPINLLFLLLFVQLVYVGIRWYDVLDNALAYVETRPKYKSRYYQTGYPDDGYGVCTDVVAFALKNAGYDLQALVDADIREHPQRYDIRQPDANIGFRRVRNLKVFFAHHAAALTTDVSRTEEWQGGDLVIFEKHIGIVSDRRNRDGVPYVIHHNSPWQSAYEQDILEKRTDIVGHYRISE